MADTVTSEEAMAIFGAVEDARDREPNNRALQDMGRLAWTVMRLHGSLATLEEMEEYGEDMREYGERLYPLEEMEEYGEDGEPPLPHPGEPAEWLVKHRGGK